MKHLLFRPLPAAFGATLVLAATPALGGGWTEWVWRPALEVLVFFGFFLALFRMMQGKGIVLLLLAGFFILQSFARELELERLKLALETILQVAVIALVIIFQPELRRGLRRMGDTPFIKLFVRSNVNPVEEVIAAALRLAKNKIGALIAFEREASLNSFVEGGVKADAEVSTELVETIFFPGSALHDGAVIIQEERIAAAGCLFPLTDNPSLSKQLGTRHRAAIGLTEETDAVTLVVSEETGKISVGVSGELHRDLDAEGLRTLLRKLVVIEDDDKKEDSGVRPSEARR
jgi:diadenylate cyclase